MSDIYTHGVSEQATISGEIDRVVEEIEIRGYGVMDSGLTSEELADYRTALDAVYARQVKELGGAELLEQARDANVTRCPLAYDEKFVRLAAHPKVFEIARRLLGDNFALIMQNGVKNVPGQPHYQSRWHRDLNYQHWICSEPLALSALFCLDRFAPETGGTWMLPGTHLVQQFPSAEFVKRYEVPVMASAGQIIVTHAMLFHRAGVNESREMRRAVNHVIGRPFLAQQMDIPRMLNGRYSDDPVLAPYLGYRWNPRSSVSEWRRERLPRE